MSSTQDCLVYSILRLITRVTFVAEGPILNPYWGTAVNR